MRCQYKSEEEEEGNAEAVEEEVFVVGVQLFAGVSATNGGLSLIYRYFTVYTALSRDKHGNKTLLFVSVGKKPEEMKLK